MRASAKSGAAASARSSVSRAAAALSRARSAAPSSHRQLTSPGRSAASARNAPSALAAWPARSAMWARRRRSSNVVEGLGARMVRNLDGGSLRCRPGFTTQSPPPMRMLPPLVAALLVFLAPLSAQAGRALTAEDWYRFQAVSDLEIAPDGTAVAYLVTSYDKASDESRAALWSADWSGQHSEQLTHGESVSEPRFSPDGRSLSFLSARPSEATTQLWLLDRHGGEPRQLTHVSGEIAAYAWSPDGAHVVLVMHGAKDEQGEGSPGKLGKARKLRKAEAAAKPLVIDAYQFKEDEEGY